MRCPSCGAKNGVSRTQCVRCHAELDPRVAAFGGAAHTVRESWGMPAQKATPLEPRRRVPPYLIFILVVLAIAVAVLVQLFFIQHPNSPSAAYRLNAETFADDSLLAAAAAFDTDGDGRLSPAEAAAVTVLDCSGLGLKSLSGVELFSNLEVLDASGNDLGAVDLSHLARLRVVDLSENALRDLDLAGHSSLVSLNVSDNSMDSLDLDGCTALQTLTCPGNDLARLDLSDCTALTELVCDALNVSDNSMDSLDLDGCTALQTLTCPGNDLARLDLSDCTALTELVCDAGQNITLPISAGFFPDAGLRSALSAVDTDGDGALTLRERQNATTLKVADASTESLYGLAWIEGLTDLDVSGTSLGSLSSSELPASLITLTASGCGITEADLSGLAYLISLDLSSNPLTSVDLTGLPRLSSLDLANCQLSGVLDVSGNGRLTHLNVSGNPSLAEVSAIGVTGLDAEGAVICDAGCTVVHTAPPAAPEGQQPAAE